MGGSAVVLDGAMGEGGGQILRSALALSVVTGRPVTIRNIRAGRSKPGLRAQHRQCVLAAARISHGDCQGAEVGSGALTFCPGRVAAGSYRFEIGTAGSTSLVLHTLALPLSQAPGPSDVRITGGTHVPSSPTFDFLRLCWVRWMQAIGMAVTVELVRAGYYPPGGGEIRATVAGSSRLHALDCTERGNLRRVHGISVVSRLARSIADRQRRTACDELAGLGVPVDVDVAEVDAPSPGTAVVLCAEFEHGWASFSSLGKRGKPAERVARDACATLTAHVRARGAVDPQSADQLVLPLALADGVSRYSTTEVTPHLLTNVEVIRAMLDTPIRVDGRPGEPGTVTVGTG